MSSSMNGSETVCLTPGQVLLRAGGQGPLWRVSGGTLCVQQRHGADVALVQLALPGDWIGVERLCGEAYRFEVVALTECSLQTHALEAVSAQEVLASSFVRQQKRLDDMTRLRTGSMVQRLGHLLRLLGVPLGQAQVRPQLPTLRALGGIVDAVPETVCRELKRLLPSAAPAA